MAVGLAANGHVDIEEKDFFKLAGRTADPHVHRVPSVRLRADSYNMRPVSPSSHHL